MGWSSWEKAPHLAGPLRKTGKWARLCRAYVSDGLVAEAATWGEALEVALGAKGSPILLEETAASQGCGTTAAKKVLGVPGSAQSSNHLRS